MIELTEEPFDGEAGADLLEALVLDLNERYADEFADLTPAEVDADVAEYRAEVTAEQVRRPHGVFLVARLDGVVVGCGAVRPLDDGVGEIKRMYTAPAARRRGISRALLARLESAATELGYARLQLETGTQQPEAVALYESAGWHRIEPYGHYRESQWTICLAKDLAAP